jgi:dCMP deaminase
MKRISRDVLGLRLAENWALRGTCHRRQVGCVLFDINGVELSSGYNGPAAGEPHCVDIPCPGANCPSGTGLELCEAIHAEANALLKCPDVRRVHVCYVTHSPCLHCVKLLLNTSCQRIVFNEPYAHDAAARGLWVRSGTSRTWEYQGG